MVLAVAAAVVAGLNVASAIGNYNSAKSQARQTIKEGEIAAERRADEISRLASRQRVLYLAAGLELEGTPQAVVDDTYNILKEKAIRSSYNQQAKNIIKQARANLLGGLANAGVSAFNMYNMGSSSLATDDVTDNVTFTNASYKGSGLNNSAFVGGNKFQAQQSATQAKLSSLL